MILCVCMISYICGRSGRGHAGGRSIHFCLFFPFLLLRLCACVVLVYALHTSYCPYVCIIYTIYTCCWLIRFGHACRGHRLSTHKEYMKKSALADQERCNKENPTNWGACFSRSECVRYMYDTEYEVYHVKGKKTNLIYCSTAVSDMMYDIQDTTTKTAPAKAFSSSRLLYLFSSMPLFLASPSRLPSLRMSSYLRGVTSFGIAQHNMTLVKLVWQLETF